MEGMIQYGTELTNIVKQTSGETLSSATPWLFEPPYAFMPLPMRQSVPDEKVDEIVMRRRDKEQVLVKKRLNGMNHCNMFLQDDARNTLRTLKIPDAGSPLFTMYNRMRMGAIEMLARDDLKKNYTKFLPPTPSMPNALYDPERFLEKLV